MKQSIKQIYALNESNPATPTTIVADALVAIARRHGNKLDISKTGFSKTFNELCKEVKQSVRNVPEFVLKSLDRRLRSIVSIQAFNEFICVPEVSGILAAANIEIGKKNNAFGRAIRQRRWERRGAMAQRAFEQNFKIIDLGERYKWKDIPGEAGVIASLAKDVVKKFPLLTKPDYRDLLYNYFIWVIRTNYEKDPVIAIVANDDYVEACVNGDVVPEIISKNLVDIKCIYAGRVVKSVNGEPAYFAARPCTYGHFLKFPKPNNEENANAEHDIDDAM